MRKHPLIALIAFTTLGTSVTAGLTAGLSHSVLTSAKTALTDRAGGRPHTAIANDIWLRNRLDLDAITGRQIERTARPHPRHVPVEEAAPLETPPPATEPSAPAAPATQASSPAATTGGVWYELRMCESGDDYSTDTGNGYYGAYQFALSTWYGLGFTGLPSDAPPAVQDQAAEELQARSGWGQWPVCAAKLGLY